MLYRIKEVSGTQAIAERAGEEAMPDVSWLDTGLAQPVFAAEDDGVPTSSGDKSGDRKLIAMYVTHSDESYVPSDGTQSIEGQGGIYDVARDFRDALQERGIDVILDESTHLPHDSGAYRRSRRTAERLLQNRPDAIIDIHRDGIPDPEEYETTIGGKNASQVRLLVGRSNQNSEVNRAFAKQIKAVADKKYPGLIKDIFIGKGNYNQDLSPNAILLEFGTHTISKERVLGSTDVMADVVSTTLYGPETGSAKSAESAASGAKESAQKETDKAKNKGSMSGILLLAILVIAGVIIFAFAQTGSGKGMGKKIGRNIREMTGGLIGRKKDKK
ncbi:MAG: stage II sporulation protein P [Clostridiales bacterium]|nr:stage II sporulation protein P [Clostridiales bacterium]